MGLPLGFESDLSLAQTQKKRDINEREWSNSYNQRLLFGHVSL